MAAVLAPVAPARRGRPSNADLSAKLTASREINATLRAEVRALRHEGRDFATTVRASALRIHMAASAGSRMACINEAGAIVAAADRHLRQRGGSSAA